MTLIPFMPAPLFHQISQYVPFAPAELELIGARFTPRHCKPREFLLRAGEVATHLHFLVSGLVRVFHLRDGREITTYLACDGGFVSSFGSFIPQTPAWESIQCIEATETLSIRYADLQALYATLPATQQLGRILAEQGLICMADRLLKLHAMPAREKYRDFVQTAPAKIVQRTPLTHIASFLGIRPESLSRIRREFS